MNKEGNEKTGGINRPQETCLWGLKFDGTVLLEQSVKAELHDESAVKTLSGQTVNPTDF